MNLSEYIQKIGYRESPFHGVCRYSPSGEEYITLESDKFLEKSEAINDYMIRIKEYLLSCQTAKGIENPTVYWRIFPKLIVCGDTVGDMKYMVRSRLICSGKDVDTYFVAGGKLLRETNNV